MCWLLSIFVITCDVDKIWKFFNMKTLVTYSKTGNTKGCESITKATRKFNQRYCRK